MSMELRGAERGHRVQHAIGASMPRPHMRNSSCQTSGASNTSQSRIVGSSPPSSPTKVMDNSDEVQMGQFETQNIDDLLEKREWELKNERNWIDGGGETFVRDYLNLPSPPTPRMPHLRERRTPQTSAPIGPPLPSQSIGRGQNSHGKKTRARWSNEDLKQAMGALDSGYNMKEVCEAYSIPRTSLRDHYNGRVICRKMEP